MTKKTALPSGPNESAPAPAGDLEGLAKECAWETDAKHVVSHISTLFESITESPAEALLGKTWFDFVGGFEVAHDNGADVLAERFKRGKSIRSVRCCIAGRTGRMIHLVLSGKPRLDKAENIVGYIGTVADITPYVVVEEGLQRSEGELRNILDNMQDVFFRTDRRGRISLLSPSASDLTGFPPANLLHQRVLALVSGAKERRHLLGTIRDGAGTMKGVVTRIRTRDGEDRWVSVNAHVVLDANGLPAGVEGSVRDVDQIKRSEDRLRQSERRYRRLVELSPNGVLVHRDGAVLYANHEAAQQFGIDSAKDVVGRQLMEFIHPDSYAAVKARTAKLADGWATLPPEDIILNPKDGVPRVVEVHTGVTEYAGGIAHQSLIVDVTDRRNVEHQLSLAATVFDTALEAILISSSDNKILAVNDAFCEITGYSQEEVIGANPKILSSGRHDDAFYQALWGSLNEHGRWQGEVWNRRKNGELYPEWLSIAVVKDSAGQVHHNVAIFTDITQRKKDEERIRYQANFDALTGLPNRNLFMDRLWQTLAVARREETHVALMFIDLDRFKLINDTLGHAAGDFLLVEAARRLREAVREEDTVARLGGDEFTIILPNIDHETDAAVVAEKVLMSLLQAFDLDGTEAHVSGSVGITLYPRDGDTGEDLLKNADAAMYRAKDRGRNAYHFYTPEIQEQAKGRLHMENALRSALENQEFEVHYQPQIDIATGGVCGAEALIRWHHPDRGLVSPDDFIPISEETGLITPIGEWVLRDVCRQIVEWDKAGLSVPRVAVNLSLRQFKDQDIPKLVEQVAAETGVKTTRLELELTESLFAEDVEEMIKVMRRLKDLGVKLAIDDFGTGYSSLAYLRRFPIDVLKIDRSFIDGVTTDPDDAAIAEAIIAMAHRLNFAVVAEGIETHDQLDFLHHLHCDIGQGYLISRPMPEKECREWLSERMLD